MKIEENFIIIPTGTLKSLFKVASKFDGDELDFNEWFDSHLAKVISLGLASKLEWTVEVKEKQN